MKNSKHNIIIMFCYARSGGTLLNKCLGVIPETIVMSEVNPLGGGWGKEGAESFTTIKEQAKHWYNIDLISNDFKDSVAELSNYCHVNNKILIIRDWSFINFTPHEYNSFNPPNDLLTYKILSKEFNVIPFAFIRNAIDIWISRGMPPIEEFSEQYLNYINKIKELNIPIFKYENFCNAPQKTMKEICNLCGISYEDNFIDNYIYFDKVNGDVQNLNSRSIKDRKIKLLPRKIIANDKINEINSCKKISDANEIYNYKVKFDNLSFITKYKSKLTNTFSRNNIFNISYEFKIKIRICKQSGKNIMSLINNKVGTSNLSNREVWLEKTLKNIPDGLRILDAGAGELQYKKFCGHLNYVSQDFGQYDGQGDNSGLQTQSWDNSKLDIISDITSIPEPDSSFDAIMCIEVFEHLPNPVEAIKEFSRLLRSGGYLIITAPFCSLTHFAPYHFSTGFNRYFYQRNLEDNEFEITEIEANGNYFEYIAQEIRRLPEMGRKYSSSKLNILEKLSYYVTLKMLSRFSKNDKKSNELLCFGYHVLARKK